jgi:hypothetical protein
MPTYFEYLKLQEENDQLKVALRQIAKTPDHYTIHMVRTHARAALGENKDVDHDPFPIEVNKDCISKNPERMCMGCDCWKYTRQMCG